MQFDVIIGNPPYQLDDGGDGTSDCPDLPAVRGAGEEARPALPVHGHPVALVRRRQGLDEFREPMLTDRRMRSTRRLPEARRGVSRASSIKGGVCYFLWDRDHDGPVRASRLIWDGRVDRTAGPRTSTSTTSSFATQRGRCRSSRRSWRTRRADARSRVSRQTSRSALRTNFDGYATRSPARRSGARLRSAEARHRLHRARRRHEERAARSTSGRCSCPKAGTATSGSDRSRHGPQHAVHR